MVQFIEVPFILMSLPDNKIQHCLFTVFATISYASLAD